MTDEISTIKLKKSTKERLFHITASQNIYGTADELINKILDIVVATIITKESEPKVVVNFTQSESKTDIDVPQHIIDEIREFYKGLGYVSNIDEEIERSINAYKKTKMLNKEKTLNTLK